MLTWGNWPETGGCNHSGSTLPPARSCPREQRSSTLRWEERSRPKHSTLPLTCSTCFRTGADSESNSEPRSKPPAPARRESTPSSCRENRELREDASGVHDKQVDGEYRACSHRTGLFFFSAAVFSTCLHGRRVLSLRRQTRWEGCCAWWLACSPCGALAGWTRGSPP
jgi:hypothetical protein